ncbi:Ig-like domain-containing protein [Celeribacter sp.]|uniref:Ig-like domain-containing protein n=1 Tax=Celeribacter sp. TaxID=1890673 RepID=UPI003A91624E
MSTMVGLQFTVRNSAGEIDTGNIPLVNDVEVIRMAGIEDISLNTTQAAISGYTRSGGDLILTLVGGKEVRLEGFFVGGEKELLLSERGFISEVEFADTSEGALVASYGDVDLSGKWSEYDQLVFLDLERVEPVVAPVLGAGLGPLLGLGGGAAAALAAGTIIDGGGNGGAADTTAPDVVITGGTEGTGTIVNGEDYDSGSFTISGEGEPGATIDVTVNDTTETTTVGDDGSWSVDFESDAIDEGEYSTDVTVTATDDAGNSTTVTDSLLVDTEAEKLTFDTVAGDNVINIDEATGDVTVSGTSEAGATVVVTMQGQEVETTVAQDGTWSVIFDGTQFAPGTYDSTISATVTDVAGNAASYTHDVHLDLESSLTVDADSAGGDGTVNLSEMQSGVALSGTGEAGSTVVVTVAGVSRTTTIGNDGSWTVNYANGTLPQGTYDATVTAVSTDAAGNTSTTSGTFHIDTEMGVAIDPNHSGGDNIVNLSESSQPLTFTGTAEPGSTVVVTLQGVNMETTVGTDGVWSVTLPAGTLPSGEYNTTLTAVATDAAGNTATSATSVRVDTEAGDVALSSSPIEGDDIINFEEVADGVWVTGTATPGLDVVVTLGGVSHTVRASSGGSFAVKFAASEVTAGEYMTEATATITDDAGNTKTVTRAVEVDTYVNSFNNLTSFGGSDGVVNKVEADAGVGLNGQVEPHSTVVITVGGSEFTTIANGAGEWSYTLPAGIVPSGEGSIPIQVVATDRAGNVARLSDTLTYDTLVTELDMDSDVGGADGVFNGTEMDGGLTLTGEVEPGSTVFVTVDGERKEAQVDGNGNWTVSYDDGVIAGGERNAEVTIEARDAAGNTLTETSQIEIDTIGTEPVVEAVMRDTTGVRSVSIEETTDDVTAFAVSEAGQVTEVASTDIDVGGETMMVFGNKVPNGSQIVLSSEDTAGNQSDTLFVLDTTNERPEGAMFEVDLDNTGLDDFELGAIDLQFVNGGQVTLNAADLDRLAGVDGAITIHGGEDDRVVLEGATHTGQSTDVDGATYDVYTLGTEGQVLVEHGVEVVLP